nr:hypothetical protein [Thermomonospora catenispora]
MVKDVRVVFEVRPQMGPDAREQLGGVRPHALQRPLQVHRVSPGVDAGVDDGQAADVPDAGQSLRRTAHDVRRLVLQQGGQRVRHRRDGDRAAQRQVIRRALPDAHVRGVTVGAQLGHRRSQPGRCRAPPFHHVPGGIHQVAVAAGDRRAQHFGGRMDLGVGMAVERVEPQARASAPSRSPVGREGRFRPAQRLGQRRDGLVSELSGDPPSGDRGRRAHLDGMGAPDDLRQPVGQSPISLPAEIPHHQEHHPGRPRVVVGESGALQRGERVRRQGVRVLVVQLGEHVRDGAAHPRVGVLQQPEQRRQTGEDGLPRLTAPLRVPPPRRQALLVVLFLVVGDVLEIPDGGADLGDQLQYPDAMVRLRPGRQLEQHRDGVHGRRVDDPVVIERAVHRAERVLGRLRVLRGHGAQQLGQIGRAAVGVLQLRPVDFVKCFPHHRSACQGLRGDERASLTHAPGLGRTRAPPSRPLSGPRSPEHHPAA